MQLLSLNKKQPLRDPVISVVRTVAQNMAWILYLPQPERIQTHIIRFVRVPPKQTIGYPGILSIAGLLHREEFRLNQARERAEEDTQPCKPSVHLHFSPCSMDYLCILHSMVFTLGNILSDVNQRFPWEISASLGPDIFSYFKITYVNCAR